MNYPGIDGFLGTRASLMLDLVSLAMVAVLPVLGWSVWQVRYRKKYHLHKRVQLALGAVLAVAVTAFEVDIRLHGWTERAAGTPGGQVPTAVYTVLWVHLFFAISTTVLWIFVITQALRRIPNPPGPGPYSPRHIFWARLAAADMFATSLTGWVFYVMAFVR